MRASPKRRRGLSSSGEPRELQTRHFGNPKGRQATLRRPYRTIVLVLMVGTSSIAVFDLYLFASSGLH